MSEVPRQRSNKRTALWLGALVMGMFGFAIFVMPPLYDLFCEVTGIESVGGRTSELSVRKDITSSKEKRFVTVKFDGTVNSALPWEFKPKANKMKAQLGKTYTVLYTARNLAEDDVTGQAIPSVIPWQATEYFHKVECFCFTKQKLEARENKDMPLRFSVSPDLPEGINSLTLSYSFMRLSAAQDKEPVHSAGTMAPKL